MFALSQLENPPVGVAVALQSATTLAVTVTLWSKPLSVAYCREYALACRRLSTVAPVKIQHAHFQELPVFMSTIAN